MKIVQLLPGSGGTFYCENCLRDTMPLEALRRQGHELTLVPLYLPLYADRPDLVRENPVFFGAINSYLQQQYPLFRRTPRWLDRVFDSRWLLRLAARQAGSTQASGLGEMTLSMLHGSEGNQAKELERLVTWLESKGRPDVVHISTILLLGLARRIKEVLDVPIVCSMQDEDTWIDHVEPENVERCWEAIRQRLPDCDLVVSVSDTYRDAMCDRLGLDPKRVATVYPGVPMDGYEASDHEGPPTIGYLSRLMPSHGLETLVKAFMILKKKPGLEDLRFKAMGGMVGQDRQHVRGLRAVLADAGMARDSEFLDELGREARVRFLKSLTLMSVPAEQGEAFGMFMVEAWAAGVPVVQPRAGAFPELVALTGGGEIYDGNSPESLAAAIEPLLRDRERARELGTRGREAASREFTVERMAERMAGVYGGLGNGE